MLKDFFKKMVVQLAMALIWIAGVVVTAVAVMIAWVVIELTAKNVVKLLNR